MKGIMEAFGSDRSGSYVNCGVCVSHLVLSNSATPWIVATRLLCPWNFLGKNTGVGGLSFSRGSSQLRDGNCVAYISCIDSQIFYH